MLDELFRGTRAAAATLVALAASLSPALGQQAVQRVDVQAALACFAERVSSTPPAAPDPICETGPEWIESIAMAPSRFDPGTVLIVLDELERFAVSHADAGVRIASAAYLALFGGAKSAPEDRLPVLDRIAALYEEGDPLVQLVLVRSAPSLFEREAAAAFLRHVLETDQRALPEPLWWEAAQSLTRMDALGRSTLEAAHAANRNPAAKQLLDRLVRNGFLPSGGG